LRTVSRELEYVYYKSHLTATTKLDNSGPPGIDQVRSSPESDLIEAKVHRGSVRSSAHQLRVRENLDLVWRSGTSEYFGLEALS
jgi:hypothetical protein